MNEYFPAYPLHSAEVKYAADKKTAKSDDIDDCNKFYPDGKTMTPGCAHLFCRHRICKGFVGLTNAESPSTYVKILTRRLKRRVQCRRRIFIYDNVCNLHKTGLRRGAKSLSKFKLFVDRHHWANHTGCSSGYNSKRYTYLKNVNTQMCEQKNHSLRKLSATLRFPKRNS